jgi:RNA polymerase sigma factor (sigma-70 family)
VTESRQQDLARRFEESRDRLWAVAFRMLGASGEADEAVQEAWLRLARSDSEKIENLPSWLTTVVSRICLDVLRAREARREEPLGPHVPDPIVSSVEGGDPANEALVADSVGLAMLGVLETLSPEERVAFVLHDTFSVPFEQIADCSTGRRWPRERQPAAPVNGSRPNRRRPTSTSSASGRSSTPSSRPPAKATSTRWSRSSTRKSSSARTAARPARRPTM